MSTLSLAAVLAEAARRYPDKTAVVDGAPRVSYRQLWLEARQLTNNPWVRRLADRAVIAFPEAARAVRRVGRAQRPD